MGKSTAEISALRHFNRFYTRTIGALQEHLLESPFSLTEMRVLYELAHRGRTTAAQVGADLGLDAGYLSRILARFGRRGFLARTASPSDRRQTLLSLSAKGRAAFAPFDARQDREVAALLAPLPAGDRARLLSAMATIERLLGGRKDSEDAGVPYILRPPRAGDLGWVVQRHGQIYSQEYGLDQRFEALVAGVVSQFVKTFDPQRERCWIAERDGTPVGSIFCVRAAPTVAKLRMLLVDPEARGLGLGRRLVQECIAFARQAGYRKMTLWTHSNLLAARHLYEEAGFHLVSRERDESFGQKVISEIWDLDLTGPPR